MICSIRRKMVNRATIWFYNCNTDTLPDADIVEFVQAYEKEEGSADFLSLMTDLTEDENSLLNGIEKQTRYEIRRAAKAMPEYQCLGLHTEILPEELEEFYKHYNEFASAKGLPAINKKEMGNYAAQGKLMLSKAVYDGYPTIYHVYAYQADCSRLLHSISLYRTDKTVSASMVGMLNRWLHWQDMLYQKQAGFKMMDWGGISYENPAIANITKFKKDFGGKEWTGYSYAKALTTRGKLFLKAVCFVSRR